MVKRLILALALVFGALALTPVASEAAPLTTAAASIAKDGTVAAEPARWRRYGYYRRGYYRPRRYYVRRYYYPRRHYYRRYW